MSFAGPHPHPKKHARGLTLPRRSAKSTECAICAPRFLGAVYPQEFANHGTRRDFLKLINSSSDEQAKYNANLEAYLKKEDVGDRRDRRDGGEDLDPEPEPGAHDAEVQATIPLTMWLIVGAPKLNRKPKHCKCTKPSHHSNTAEHTSRL